MKTQQTDEIVTSSSEYLQTILIQYWYSVWF